LGNLGVIFSCVVEGRFCRGFCGKQRFDRGVFVVQLWWIAGGLW
jgi:hypothetical protein